MQHKFFGTGVALVTPFDAEENVDFNGLKKLLAHTAEGVDYFVVQGTTGESVTTTKQEKADILKFVKENNPKNLPIVYGIGGNNTAEVLKTISETDLSGVDAILSVSPYYNKPSQEGIFQHYQQIADKSPVPVVLYNVPGRTASNISPQTTLRLAQHPNIIGTKEASGSIDQALEIARKKPEDFLLISGDDMLTIPLMALGASGVISVMANSFPVIFKKMVKAALDNDYNTARKFAHQLHDINPLMYVESNPVGVKEALRVLN
ncbi:4-hydroxy-tetrahydrodipicolinate synthase, partial [Xanthovirga aplysinae]|uniref:4-hydroxy-tetrahydrodipicolinate synthase n=1 Tax=Xanthovirga aplysinae TaxID=2529853 RepID=UPI0012BBD7D9